MTWACLAANETGTMGFIDEMTTSSNSKAQSATFCTIDPTILQCRCMKTQSNARVFREG